MKATSIAFCQADHKTAVHKLGTAQSEPGRRQPDSAFQAAIGNLKPMDPAATSGVWKPPLARDPQNVRIDRHIEIVRLGTRQGHDDPELTIRFKNVDRRFPDWSLHRGEAGLEKP